MNEHRWQLPRGVKEVLPTEAKRLEGLRRRILDTFYSWGYELVVTPLIEYLDALLTGTGRDLELQTFKLTDQLSGRLLGVRADMTPQVARIDAHQLRRQVPTRLCYLAPVLLALPTDLTGSRNPLQVGAELYGHAGLEADVEIILLMLETLSQVGLAEDVYVDLGHVGVFIELAQQSGLDETKRMALFEALQRKARPEVLDLIKESSMQSPLDELFLSLLDLNGDIEEFDSARIALGRGSAAVLTALDEVAKVADGVLRQAPGVNLHFDLAELRGYHYHTGICFAAYAPGQGQGVARGGRYDNIGQVFGEARPATGFSADLKLLVDLANDDGTSLAVGILAPYSDDGTLLDVMRDLRQRGERVVQALPGQKDDPAAMGCDRRLVFDGNSWQVEQA
jgi:ATP phosphoribosyltransferase regulatory subunit